MLVYMGTFSYMPSAGFTCAVSLTHPMLASLSLWGVSLILSMLASLCREFLVYKRKKKKCKTESEQKMHITE